MWFNFTSPLFRIFPSDIIKMLSSRNVEIVVVAVILAIDGGGDIVAPETRHLECLGVRLSVGDATVAGLGLDAHGVVQVVQVPGVQRSPARRLRTVPARLVVVDGALVVETFHLALDSSQELQTT